MNAPLPPSANQPGPPLWLLAEVTYRCPLHCAFCYNPVDFARHETELSTADWLRVLREARAAGSVQCGFSGGEPLMRDDLETLVAEAHRLGFYTNLLTSGVGLTASRAQALQAAGLDHIQLSFQDSTRELNDFLSHTRTFDLKQRVAGLIKDNGWPMVMNCVIHRLNIDYIDRIIEMAVELGAEYLELANSQYYSWALLNRDQLMPSRAQLERAERITNAYRERLGDRIRIFFVVPDYYETRPKKCMNGWGQVFLTVTPDGTALPCHTARMLPGLDFPNVREMDVRSIWYGSEGFNRYRGDAWMKDPCRACPDKDKDHGGCRCQAWMLAGDPAAADPVCDRSPEHDRVRAAVEQACSPAWKGGAKPLVFRDPRRSRELGAKAADA
ncbi:pyrroloquinoline quinone biosynthesis protein PqqE [Thauera linaloolentis]|uniref:PqqA peptide cyclase n=1 Tax=Thauera linaloolentis (strain DSM 12138 / JCM 21573 / CCUG 41526 / CIP 105981 / IAM 15112 / NBRC 102519 / 47Lol) TaxID=1123367 RepID=N6Y7M3_THAL4|nr:pyrroloquinoline quinone biosynthesis protein PqqE [Thauera linaloolentis]ENO87575.1 pyrroloquinoline quinone biosynthesis protein PqqE [Thauera linaloolentis 47Lol = DSM 12138]MCM8564159.1 pyrroloquinoline quinone biosynthesis protein PqqE [Thauera linaloolentis]